MRIADLIGEDLIQPDLAARNEAEVIQELGAFLARHHEQIDEEDAVRVLAERERLGSTAVGDGLAIPHAKLPSVHELMACLGRSRKGIEFDAADGRPSRFFFVLIAPDRAPGVHLKALARISRLFRSARFRARLEAAKSAREMYEIIAAAEDAA